MKCSVCAATMVSRRENYRYDECDLPNVTLLNIEVRRCPACGERAAVIPRVEELHRGLALAVIRKPNRLAPREIRFLRKYLGWSGVDFARHMGVNPQHVSRWESTREPKPMGPTADRALRLMVAIQPPVRDYSLDHLAELSRGTEPLALVTMRVTPHGWERDAA
ncbi:MAG TPA: type II TA system antitoxin MqsA family protein [Polyangia bacterium]|jgi:putative zinc finger/helix-turn-helix YgiT family protein